MNAPAEKPRLRRVRREEASQTFHKPDPYARLMACWADFMRVDDRDLGADCMKLRGEATTYDDVYDAQRKADLRVGEAVNAMVDSLSTVHRWAICKSQSIATVWRFQNANYEDVLLVARDLLEEKLRKNIATRIYFL